MERPQSITGTLVGICSLNSRIRNLRLPAEDAIALTYLLSGLAYVADPAVAERSPLGEAVEPFTAIWSILYLLGGLAVLCGRRGFLRIEFTGLGLLATAWAGTYVATVFVLGFDLKALLYLVLTAFAVTRANELLRA